MTRKKSTATRRAESQAASARAAVIRREHERKERRRRSLVVSAIGVAVLALVLGIGYAVQSSRDSTGASAAAPAGAAGYAVPVGPASAPVKVTIYEDFLCPFCGQFEAASRARMEAGVAAGKVQVRYRVLNFLDKSSTTSYSSRAANALAVVLDASGPTVAKRFHDLLYENQPQEGSAGISDARLVDYAVQAGSDRAKVTAGIKDDSFGQWVENGTAQASKDKVSSTPTVQIDGRTVEFSTIEELVAALDKAVAAA